jgi:hypothetical protein
MLVYISTKFFQGQVNLDCISKIIPRPRDGDERNSDWEVAVFYENIRRINPVTGSHDWIGSYDVFLRDTKEICQQYVKDFNKPV